MLKKISKKKLSDSELKELQHSSLNLLLYFQKFCKENNLLMYLCGGGCIGSIRHKGFIPWDDDIDIFMPRKDYEKLHELWNKKADVERYSCIRTTKNFFTGNIFTTVIDNNTTLIKPNQMDFDIPHGVALDVFPLDGYPSSKISRHMQVFFALIYSLYLAQVVPENHGKVVRFVGKMLLFIVPSKRLRYNLWRFAEKQMSKYSIDDCEYITELCAGPFYMKKKYPKEAFMSAVYKDFEGYKVPLPVGYDEYLKIAFGDYMKLPPEDKRVAHHDIYFLDLNSCYKKYKGQYYCVDKNSDEK